MSNDVGPWGPRSREAAEAALRVEASATQAQAAQSQAGQPFGPIPTSPSIWVNLVSTALLAAFLWLQAGWMWALAGVLGVFVHEYGHVIAMNLLGCGPARIRIIPFLGGAAVPARAPATEFRGVLIALAGPAFGLLAMAPFFAAYFVLGETRWLAGAFFVAAINLLNLAPAPPLDGSKALGPTLAWLHPGLEKAAVVVIGAAAAAWLIWRGSLLLGAFIGIAALGALRTPAFRPPMLRLTAREWVLSLVLYLATAGACVFALWAVLSEDPHASLTLFGLGR